MAEEEWIVQTQETLGKLIQKPKMTEKYLKKPPFRFLHDIVMEVTRTTTFGEGLFTAEESDAANLGDKAAKVEFLNKAISCTSFALGEKIEVLANKIVAGLEADKTNMWLQKLHAAATTCAGEKSAEAVSRVLAGETVAAPKREKKKREEDPAAAGDKPAEDGGAAADEEAKKEEERRRRAEKKKREEEKRRRAEEEAAKAAAEEGAGAPEAPPAPPADADAEEEQRKREKQEERRKKEEQKKRHEEKKRLQAEEEARRQAEEQEQQQQALAAQQQAAADAAAAEAAAQQQAQWAAQQQAEAEAAAMAMQQQAAAAEDERARMMMDNGEPEMPSMPSAAAPRTDGPPGSADMEAMLAAQAEGAAPGEEMGAGIGRPARVERPRTAGRKPPKVTSKVTTRQDEPGLTGGVAPPTIIAEGQKDDNEPDDLFEAPEQPGFMSVVKADQNAPHGKLVRDLLAEKSEMEDKEKERLRQEEENTREEVDDDSKKGIKMGKLRRKKDQSSSYSEIDVVKLSETIQQLCQAANPLGKSIDLVHQDIANMGKELDHWKQEYREASEQYQNEMKMTDELLQPLDQKIAELNEKIAEQKSKIRNSRSRISKNDLKIQSLLESVVLAK